MYGENYVREFRFYEGNTLFSKNESDIDFPW